MIDVDGRYSPGRAGIGKLDSSTHDGNRAGAAPNLLHSGAAAHPPPRSSPLMLLEVPNLLYVLGIPALMLLAGVLVCFGLYQVLGRVLRS
jgi:hypothetical protein